MDLKTPLLISIAVLMLSVTSFSIFISEDADALPQGYPVHITGGYATEQEGETVYVDYLQPGSTENYLVHLFNDGQEQVRYRLQIVDSPEEWLVFLKNGIQETVVDLDPGTGSAIDLNMKTPKELTGDIELLVTDESSSAEWDLTLRIICQSGPLLVSVPSGTYIVGRETPSEFEIELSNIGNTVLNVSLGLDGIVTSDSRIDGVWTVIFSEKDVSVNPGVTRTVRATVWCPELEPEGSQKVSSVIASVSGITRPFETKSMSFVVQTIFDLRSSVLPVGYQDVTPGDKTEFTISIENWADDFDTVTMNIFEKPSGWDVVFNDTIDPTSVPFMVDPEGERMFHPIVYVPRNAIAGEQMVQLLAEGTTNTTMIYLRVRVEREDLFDLTAITSSASEGTYRITVGENILPFKVVNKGNFYDTVKMVIETSPTWSTLSFHSIVIGSGDNVSTVQASGGVNVSGETGRKIIFQEDPITTISISFDPGQTATVYLKTDISLSATAQSGVLGIKYSYGIFQEQRFLQTSLKLILADITIVDLDGDGTADLMVDPEPDYEVGDTIGFSWVLRNDYPYETSDLEWSIELSGQILIEGDVGAIGPGETKQFNESWKADKSTNYRNKAILRIKGDVFPSEDRAPSAMTSSDVYIEPGEGTPPWGLMILFGGFMILLIGGFIGFFIWVRKDLEEKEAQERERYESLYGKKDVPGLKGEKDGGRKRAGSLGSRDRPGLPSSSRAEDDVSQKRPSKSRRSNVERRGGTRKEKAGSLRDLNEPGSGRSRSKRMDDDRPGKARKPRRSPGEPSKTRKRSRSRDEVPELEELEVMEEMEEV